MSEVRDPERPCAPFAALLLATVFLVPGLFTRGAMPPDETRYADVALAMRESGEWLVPRLHQKWYLEKPPVFFWATAGLSGLGVPIETAPRLVSTLAALGILLLLPPIARGFALSAASAQRGALVLATLPLFVIYGQLGFLDLLLAFEVAAALALKLARERTSGERRAARLGLAAAEGIVVALALLTKGPVALLFWAGPRIGAVLARRPEGTRAVGGFDRLDLVALLVAVAAALGWLAAAASVAGRDYASALTLGQLERRVAGTETKHHVFPGFLLLVLLVGGFPWSVLALGSEARWRARDLLRPPARLAALVGAGLLPPLLIALLPSQQPHYALPSLAPLALLAGEALAQPARAGAARLAGSLVAGLGIALLAAVVGLRWVLHHSPVDEAVVRKLGSDRVLQAAIAAAGLGLLVAAFWRRPRVRVEPATRALAGVAACALALPLAWWRVDDVMTARPLVDSPALAHARRIVAPTGLRSSIRLRTRLPGIEEYDGRDLAELLREDPRLVAVAWRSQLERDGLLARIDVLAHGFLRGRELDVVRGPLRPEPRH
jgi:4-amino-4-deoxy-L-arabinose transferase-like glycosyltransferase